MSTLINVMQVFAALVLAYGLGQIVINSGRKSKKFEKFLLFCGEFVSIGHYKVFDYIVKLFFKNTLPKERIVRSCPKLDSLVKMSDFLPIALRKKIKSLAGDYDSEIRLLHKKHRYAAARWNKWLAWYCAAWYILRSPFDSLSKFVTAFFKVL